MLSPFPLRHDAMSSSSLFFMSCLFMAALLSRRTDAAANVVSVSAMQSGPRADGSTFPSAMIADPNNEHLVHLIGNNEHINDGSSSSSMCAYKSLDLRTMEIVQSLDFGTGQDICHSLSIEPAHDAHNHHHVHVVGHSVKGGMVVNVQPCNTGFFCLRNVEYYGMILDVVLPDDGDDHGEDDHDHQDPVIEGAAILTDSLITYPLSVASDEDAAYVVSWVTDNTEKVADGDDDNDNANITVVATNVTVPEPVTYMTNPSENFDMGKLFQMKVEVLPKTNYTPKFLSDNVTAVIAEAYTSDDGWHHELTPGKEDESILDIAPIVLMDDVVIVAGSTDGSGTSLGIANSVKPNVDGFVTKLVKSTGEAVGDSIDTAGQIGSYRITTDTDSDEYVKSICRGGHSKNHIYVTGSTTGRLVANKTADGETRGFLMKIKLEDMQPEWIVELHAKPSTGDVQASPVEGLACAANQNHTSVYVAGNVYNGGTMSASTHGRSAGGSDIFLAKIDVKTGALEYVRQFGSAGDERLAPRGGLLITKEENAILYGQTNGSLYRSRNQTTEKNFLTDYFITVISADGTLAEQSEEPLPLTDPPATEAPTVKPTASPTTAPTTEEEDDNPTGKDAGEYTFDFASVKLKLNGVGYFDKEAAEAFEKTTIEWYQAIYEKRLRRRLEESNITSITSFSTNVSYWGGSAQGSGNVITYNQSVTFSTDRQDVDDELAQSLIVEPFLDEDLKQDYIEQLAASHATFEPLEGVTGSPNVPDKDRPKNSAGSLDFKLFIYIGIAIMIMCACYGVFTMRNIEGKNAKEEDYDPKDDIDSKPEAPLDNASMA